MRTVNFGLGKFLISVGGRVARKNEVIADLCLNSENDALLFITVGLLFFSKKKKTGYRLISGTEYERHSVKGSLSLNVPLYIYNKFNLSWNVQLL